VLTAQAAGGVGDALSRELLKNGLLGLALLAVAWLAYKLILRETARADRAEQQLAELNREVREKAIPALVDSARATTEATQATTEATQAVKDVAALLRERR
jgi:hypothetical protein